MWPAAIQPWPQLLQTSLFTFSLDCEVNFAERKVRITNAVLFSGSLVFIQNACLELNVEQCATKIKFLHIGLKPSRKKKTLILKLDWCFFSPTLMVDMPDSKMCQHEQFYEVQTLCLLHPNARAETLVTLLEGIWNTTFMLHFLQKKCKL